MPVGSEELYQEAVDSLRRIQDFDVASLPRESDLGAQLNLKDAVEPAQLLVDLYRRLSVTALEDFPDNFLKTVRDNANSNYKLFQEALEFSAEQQQNPWNVRQSIVEKIASAYQPTFTALHPLIAYSLHRSADFQRLDTEARATLQMVEDRAAGFAGEMEQYSKDAERVLEEIRAVAAEEGVT